MKISKLDRRLIASVAKRLPVMIHSNERLMMKKMDVSGQPYFGYEPETVNHRKELEKMFIKFGDEGIATYENKILQSAK